jgi:hypothetical protein
VLTPGTLLAPPPPRRRLAGLAAHLCAACVACALASTAGRASADDAPVAVTPVTPATPASLPAATVAPADPDARWAVLSRPVDLGIRIVGSLEFGRGLRFNDPFRLATELGSSAQSVSLTATYADIALAVVVGPPDGLQHGAALHASFALSGVPQAVLTPTYMLAYRGAHPWLAYGRIGPSFVLTPDPTVGGEVAAGFAWFFTGRVAIAGELVFDVYYGAGTPDVAVATYPILSGQLGLLVDQEIFR